MRNLKKLENKRFFWVGPIILGLLVIFQNELAIPDPLPKHTQEASKAESNLETKNALARTQDIHPFRKEHMTKILSRFHTGLHPTEDKKLVAFISQESRKYGFEPELILALISAESSFYNWSVSNKGAVGMMQIAPETGKALAKANQIAWNEQNQRLFDPYVNIRLGVHYLHALNKRFGDMKVALAAYNFGPTKVSRWLRRGRRIPTRYANKVMRSYQAYVASNEKHLKMRKAAASVAEIPFRSDT